MSANAIAGVWSEAERYSKQYDRERVRLITACGYNSDRVISPPMNHNCPLLPITYTLYDLLYADFTVTVLMDFMDTLL
ncbi:hypothetical protein KQX54_006912 [Cotesia glomerata]|uniref:Uncharacterized protein n=1 Tax=Cotesia glomerata TaxID=32391 RepID=A0AAV7J4Q9_COTGL|nr:hypothetical protein KQX54_006912 [Cotesia glomerata]